jgi:hypothetical protein
VDGFVILEGPLICATVNDFEVSESSGLRETNGKNKHLWYDLNRGSEMHRVSVDFPIVVGTATDLSGNVRPTAKRLSEGDLILPLDNAPVWCLSIGHRFNGQIKFALILGLSSRVPGAYERLGAIQSYEDGDGDDGDDYYCDVRRAKMYTVNSWFKNAPRTTIKIV